MTRGIAQPRKPMRRERSSPKRTTYKAVERDVFARNVRTARLVLGWNQAELGYRIVGTSGYVGAVEAGQENVSIDRMATFAQAFGQPLYKLLQPGFTVSKSAKVPSPSEIMKSREGAAQESLSLRGRVPKAVMERKVFGENIRAARLSRGWTQGEVARLLGFNLGTISPTETGQISVSIDRMAAFAHLFELPLHRLLRTCPSDSIEQIEDTERKRQTDDREAPPARKRRTSPKL